MVEIVSDSSNTNKIKVHNLLLESYGEALD